MADATPATALARKIAAHARAADPAPAPGALAERGFGRALRRAAQPLAGLGLEPGPLAFRAGGDLDAALADLPERGLVAALEDDAGRRGLIGLGSGLVDALIEVQTTGGLEPVELPPRPVTRIDEALARDFIDLALSAFAGELDALDGRDWPARMTYGSRIADRGQINLLLCDGPYARFTADLRLGGGTRGSSFMLALPVDPALARGHGARKAGARPPDPDWIAARSRMLDQMPLILEAVLLRVTRPLARVEALAEGDLLPFAPADMEDVSLETAAGHAVLRARLGQIGGKRAVRLPGARPDTGGTAPAPRPRTDEPAAAGTASTSPVPVAEQGARSDPIPPSGSAADTHPAATRAG